MPKVKASGQKPVKKSRPALTPEMRENQMIALAIDVAEEQLLNRTASSQVIVHYLKLGTTKAELEKEKLKRENRLLESKAKAVDSSEEMKVLYENALKAMKDYKGYGDDDEYEED